MTEFLDGCLLGDGSIPRPRRRGLQANFVQTSKHLAHLEWLESQLASLGIQRTGSKIYSRTHNYRGRSYTSYQYVSRQYEKLVPIRERWYSMDNGKQPPRDLVLTPAMLCRWFIDDGHYRHPRWRWRSDMGKRYFEPGSVRLCNRNFTPESKEFMAAQLMELGLGINIHKEFLYMPVRYTDHFFSLIGPCPLPSVWAYKWPMSL